MASNDATTTVKTPAVEFRGLSKLFGSNLVLDEVNVRFEPGSIHALLGANGSGKSTLIKILAGYHDSSAGELLLQGDPTPMPVTPAQLHQAGIRFVHQDLGLVDNLSVADNLALDLGYVRRGPSINWNAQYEQVRKDLSHVGLDDVDPRTPIEQLGPVQRTLVAMARALRGLDPSRGVLVLDEPTARLPHTQVDELMTRCRKLRDRGLALVYVSHRLDEVFAMADYMTVLRNGKVVFSGSVESITPDELTAHITGVNSSGAAITEAVTVSVPPPRRNEMGSNVLELRGVNGVRVRNVDLDVAAGEILAVTGLVGSGASELGRIIFGAQVPTSVESFRLAGKDFRPTEAESVKRGVGYVPPDRSMAAIRNMSVMENVTLTRLTEYLRFGSLSQRLRLQSAREAIRDMDVRPPDPMKKLKELSGGNQQKVILAKWLELDLRLLILDEPAYGVDVGARKLIMDAVRERARTSGLAVLYFDTDIDLVAEYADRVLVMRNGQIARELRGNEINEDTIASITYAVA